MMRPGSPARLVLVLAALVGLTVSPTHTAPMPPADAPQGPAQVATPLGPELVIGKEGEFGHKGNIAMLFNDGQGGLTMNKIELNEFEQNHEVAVGDLNNDGTDDVAVVYSKGQVWIALGGFADGLQNSDLVFAGSFPDANNRTRVLQLGDVNNDGNLDIVVTMWAHMAVKLGNGDGTFGNPILTNATGVDARGMALGDFDGDGTLDLVANHAPGTWWLAVHKGNGNGTFQPGIVIPNSHLAIPNLFVRDADGDGDMDIYSGALNGRAKIFTNDGSANFTLTNIEPGNGLQGGLLVVEDLNGDGTPDMVAGTEANNFTNVRVWLSDGSGGFTAANYGPGGSQPRHGVVADINRDGIADLAMVSGLPGGLWTMLGNGDGTFQAPTQPIATYRRNYTIAAGHFSSPAAVACSAGTHSATGNEPCVLADPGYVVPTEGATSQTACPVGTYSSVSGATACESAPAGSYVDTVAATGSLLCPAGTYSATSGSASCTPADAGFFVPTIGSTSQMACPAGFWSNGGATECYVLDSDGDGVNDSDDAYPNSNMNATVSVGACTTTVANQVLSNGATFNDLLATAAAGATNHGKLVSAVTQLSNGWKNAGLISGRDHGAITSCTARSK